MNNVQILMLRKKSVEYSISADPTTMDFSYAGGIKDSTVTTTPTSGEWNIVSSPSWATVFKYNSTTVRASVGQNNTGNFRYGTIVVEHSQDTSKTASISLSQAPDFGGF